MSKFYPLLLLTVSTSLLSACATLGQSSAKIDCATADWTKIGQADGQAGRYPQEISRHVKQCGETVLSTEVRARWEAGRQAGIKQYCTKANLYEIGQRGITMNQVCPEEGLYKLQQSHALGYQQYYQRQRLYDSWSPFAYPFASPWYAPAPWYGVPPYRYW